jgi:hypothetical protein
MATSGLLAQLWSDSFGTARGFAHALSKQVDHVSTGLRFLRGDRPAWWQLNDHHLRDIGKTRAEADFETMRRSPAQDPLQARRDLRYRLFKHDDTG